MVVAERLHHQKYTRCNSIFGAYAPGQPIDRHYTDPLNAKIGMHEQPVIEQRTGEWDVSIIIGHLVRCASRAHDAADGQPIRVAVRFKRLENGFALQLHSTRVTA